MAEVLVDKAGRAFDPAIHLVHKTGPNAGKPVQHWFTRLLIPKPVRPGASAPAAATATPPPTATPTDPPTSLPSIGTDDIIKELHSQAPVNHAPAETQAGNLSPDLTPHLKDRHGNAFDPTLHEVDEATGQPKLSTAGRLIGRKGVRVPRPGTGQRSESEAGPAAAQRTASLDLAAASGQVDGPDGGDAAPAPDPAPAAGGPAPGGNAPGGIAPTVLTDAQRIKLAKDTAEVTVQLLQAVGRFIGGREGSFKNTEEDGNEYKELKEGYVTWYETMENLVHVSPGWVVAVNTAKYLGRVSSTETGKKRIEKGTTWATSLGSKIRLSFHALRATFAAKSNNGR